MPTITLNLDEPRFDKINYYRTAYYVIEMSSSDMFDELRSGRLILNGLDISKLYREFDDKRFVDKSNTPTDGMPDDDKIINAKSADEKNDFMAYMYEMYVSGKGGIPINSVNGGYGDKRPVVRFIWCDSDMLSRHVDDMTVDYRAYDGGSHVANVIAAITYFGPKSKDITTGLVNKVLSPLNLKYNKAVLDHIKTENPYKPRQNAMPVEATERPDSEHSDEYFESFASKMNIAETVVCAVDFNNDAKKFAAWKYKTRLYERDKIRGLIDWDDNKNSGRPTIHPDAVIYVLMNIYSLIEFADVIYLKKPRDSIVQPFKDFDRNQRDNNLSTHNVRIRTDNEFIKELISNGLDTTPYIKFSNQSKPYPVAQINYNFSNAPSIFDTANKSMLAVTISAKDLVANNINTVKELETYVEKNTRLRNTGIRSIYYVAGGNIVKLK